MEETSVNIEDYKRYHKDILFGGYTLNVSAGLYVRLNEIFVQDCHLSLHQPFFGNITKQKAKVLFNLQEYFVALRHNA